MKHLLVLSVSLCGTALYAQQAGGQAAAPAAAAETNPAELVQTMKNLSVLLERGAEIPQARKDALAPELAAFNAKVRIALGPELLAELARREKELEDAARAGAARKTLQALRAALQVHYSEQGGVYPEDLSRLAPGQLREIPELLLPEHGRTATVTVIDSRKYDKDFSEAVTDSGGWLYFSNPGAADYGLLVLDCSHTAPDGGEFFEY